MWNRRRRGRRPSRGRPDDRAPVLLPPSKRPGRWRRAATRLAWLTLGLAAIAGGVVLLEPSLLEGWLPGAPEEAGPEVEFALGSDEAGADRTEGPLAVPADSVSRALVAYRQRHADFERGRIACAELSAGYARLGEHVVALARERARLERTSSGQDTAFDAAMDAAAAADRLFDATGCPRP